MLIKKIKNKYKEIMSFKENNNIIKLTKVSIIMLLILDIFVYISISKGINYQSNIIEDPKTKYSYDCIDKIKNIDNIDNYSSLKNYNSHHYSKYSIKDISTDIRCIEINNKIKVVKDSGLVNNTLDKVEKIHKIRNNRNEKDIEIEKIRKDFENNILIKDIEKYIEENKSLLLEYESEIQKYKLKKSFIEILFLIPILVLFIILMKKYNNNGNYIKYIINKNLLIVTSIPLILNVMVLIYNIIPKKLLRDIIEILENINLPIIVYYIIVAILVTIITFIIIKIQNKKIEKLNDNKNIKEVNFVEFYNKGICNYCNNKVDYIEMNYCCICKNKLKETCKECGSKKIIGTKCCYKCGK